MSDAHAVARDQLRSFIERVELVEEEIATLNTDKSDIYKEARAVGFDVKVLRKVVAKRKLDTHVREEQDAIFDMYWDALYGAPVHVHTHARENIEENRRSDLGLSILTKHEDIRTSDGSPSVSSSLATREAEESVVSNSPETAEELQHPVPHATGANARSGGDGSTVRGARTEADAVTAGETAPNFQSDDGAIAAVNGKAGLANANGVEPPSSGHLEVPSDEREDRAAANAGGDHVESIAEREVEFDGNPNTGEGAANTALPADGVVMEYVPPTGMKRLPFAHCFPDHSKAEYERLEKDIAANRVREPIIRQGDVIVDGWARYNISRAYGMRYPVLELHPSRDVLLSIIKWQRAARNFTPAQERKIAAELAKELPHRADDIMAAFGLAEALEAAE